MLNKTANYNENFYKRLSKLVYEAHINNHTTKFEQSRITNKIANNENGNANLHSLQSNILYLTKPHLS